MLEDTQMSIYIVIAVGFAVWFALGLLFALFCWGVWIFTYNSLPHMRRTAVIVASDFLSLFRGATKELSVEDHATLAIIASWAVDADDLAY